MENSILLESKIVRWCDDSDFDPEYIDYYVVYHIGSSCRVACHSKSRTDCINWISDYSHLFPDRVYQLVAVRVKASCVCRFYPSSNDRFL